MMERREGTGRKKTVSVCFFFFSNLLSGLDCVLKCTEQQITCMDGWMDGWMEKLIYYE